MLLSAYPLSLRLPSVRLSYINSYLSLSLTGLFLHRLHVCFVLSPAIPFIGMMGSSASSSEIRPVRNSRLSVDNETTDDIDNHVQNSKDITTDQTDLANNVNPFDLTDLANNINPFDYISSSSSDEWLDSDQESDDSEDDEGIQHYDTEASSTEMASSSVNVVQKRVLTRTTAIPDSQPSDQYTSSQFLYEKKRRYNHSKRKKRSNSPSKMRKKWKRELLALSLEEIKAKECCGSACFKLLEGSNLKKSMLSAITMNAQERRNMLASMLTSRKVYHFDGIPVCGKFLLDAFRFSRDMQASVRKDPDKVYQHRNDEKVGFQKESIVDIITNLAELTAEKMPDKSEVHLPFYRKKEVYNHFISEYKHIYEGLPPTKSYFYKVWKQSCSHIKVRKRGRFTICSICESIRLQLEGAIKRKEDTRPIMVKKRAHNAMVSKERAEYSRKRNNAIRDPKRFCSVIIDGADQAAFGLPHFTTLTKDVRGNALKVRLIGILQHGSPNKLRLYTMTEEQQTGANHIVEALHRFLNDLATASKIPSYLHIQADNCVRENKNRFIFGYLESLIAWNVVDEIEMSFLPIGHTHEDIDQSFSATSNALRENNAITLGEMQKVLRSVYNKQTEVSHMQHQGNWYGLCQETGCLRPISKFTKYRYFKFVPALEEALDNIKKKTIENQSSPSPSGNIFTARTRCTTDRKTRAGQRNQSGTKLNIKSLKESMRKTKCFVKYACHEEWTPLPVPEATPCHGFLITAPDLRCTPPTLIREPPGIKDFNVRLESEEHRINSTAKLRELHELRDYVYRSRSEQLQWNISRSIEYLSLRGSSEKLLLKKNKKGSEQLDHEKVVEKIVGSSTSRSEFVTNDFDYSTLEFVATLVEEDESCPFWIGQIKNVIKNETNVVHKLVVQWLELLEGADVYGGRYKLAKRLTKKKTLIEWTDTISTDSVIITFSRLVQNYYLPVAVQKHLREMAEIVED